MSEQNVSEETTEVQVTEDAPVVSEDIAVLEDKLSKARAEAAGYRVKAREAAAAEREKVSAEYAEQITALTDEKTALLGQLDNSRLELTKFKVALAAGIPGESAADFADLLKGSSEEEIKEHAEKLKSLFGKQAPTKTARPVDTAQGRGGAVEDDSPASAFARFITDRLS